MATYLEIYDLQNNDGLHHKIAVACTIAADAIRQEVVGTANHANRIIWAEQVFANPLQIAKQALWAVLAANNTATVAQITGATDAAIQTNVNDVVDLLAQG